MPADTNLPRIWDGAQYIDGPPLGGYTADRPVYQSDLTAALAGLGGGGGAGTDATARTAAATAQSTADSKLLKGNVVTKTANYTAVLGDIVLADTTTATFAVTIPAASGGKGRIVVKWVKGTTAPTVNLTGTDHVNTSTGVQTFTPVLLNQGYQLESDGAALWAVTADDLPLSKLDARYAAAGATGGGAGLPSTIVSKTAAYTAAAGDFVEADTTSAGFTVTLPTTPAAGALVAVKKVSADGNTLTIAPAAGGTIDGDPNATTTTKMAGAIFEHKASNVWRIAASMTTTGPQGPTGATGAGATVAVGTTTTGAAGSSASVTNTGTTSAAVLNFTVPAGATGPQGPAGTNGSNGTNGANGAISQLQDEGSNLTVRPTINFVGAGVTATDDTANTRTVVTIPGGGGAVYGFLGDGSDGALTYDGSTAVLGVTPSASTYTLTCDVYATNITVNSGVTINCGGYAINATGTITNNGTIHRNGNNANGVIGGGTMSAGTLANGGSGPNGGSGNGAAGGLPGSSQPFGTGSTGPCAGGAGGAGATGSAGGANWSVMGNNVNTSRTRFTATTTLLTGAQTKQIGGGVAGGSGGGDGTNSGGGGGSGAGVVLVNALAIVNNGAISAKGGNGGTPPSGNCGGGGGAGGGAIFVNTTTAVTGTGTITAAAGSGGTGAGTGANGNTGQAGVVRTTVWSA